METIEDTVSYFSVWEIRHLAFGDIVFEPTKNPREERCDCP